MSKINAARIAALPRRLRMRHIELLDLLACESTIRAAASRMNLSQPAVSKMLMETEEIFGMPLFVRSRTGIRANAYGAALVRHATAILGQLSASMEEVE